MSPADEDQPASSRDLPPHIDSTDRGVRGDLDVSKAELLEEMKAIERRLVRAVHVAFEAGLERVAKMLGVTTP